ncbi:MAG: three-Cys-motif partner protein TcmP [Candidatus Brocadiia bacterium]|nr:MAG: three-Cys-motif partner protein TcmP [Candidatus Brocadiia bacterium]
MKVIFRSYVMPDLAPPKDDGLIIPEVGEWSRDKHYYLRRYIDAFTSSMKKKWGGLHYIDLFAGAGIEKLKDSGDLDWGSPLIAAQYPFSKLHLCELNTEKYSTLKIRINEYKRDSQILQGDANEKIAEIVNDIPKRSLSLAFLDPYGLHLEFETLKVLANKRADLIIFFPDHLDALRNWEHNYHDNPDSLLDRCLGDGTDWRSIRKSTPPEKYAEVLRNLYVKQIKSLGYTEFEYKRISMKGHPLYILIFCSRHKLAAKLWRGISSIQHDGQRTLPFD